MNPAVLGNLTVVNQNAAKAQSTALTAQQMALNASNASKVNATAITALQNVSSSNGTTFIAPAAVASGSGSASWTTVSVPGVPTTAVTAKIEVVINESNASGNQILVRQTGSTWSFVVCGMTTANNVSGYAASVVDVPLVNGQFDYEVTGGDSWTLRVVAYW